MKARTFAVRSEALPELEVVRTDTRYNRQNHHEYAPFRNIEQRKQLFYHLEQYEYLYLPWGKEQLNLILEKLNYTMHLIPAIEWETNWEKIPVGSEISKEIIDKIDLLQEGDIFEPISLKENKIFAHIYKLYSHQYNYQHWVSGLRKSFAQQPIIRTFSAKEIEILSEISENRTTKLHTFDIDDVKLINKHTNLLSDLADCINELYQLNKDFFDSIEKEIPQKLEYRENEEDYSFLDMLDNENNTKDSDNELQILNYPHDLNIFVKLFSSSAKNEKKLVPFHTVNEIIDFITGRVQFYQQDFCDYKKYSPVFDFPLGVVLLPWNEKIDTRSEFRVFVRNLNVVAISQQAWYSIFYYSDDEIQIAISSILSLFYDFVRDGLPLPSAILDITVQFDEKKAYLIEINPWGTWATSGSALYNWVLDSKIVEPTLRYEDDASFNAEFIYFRYLHTIPITQDMQINI